MAVSLSLVLLTAVILVVMIRAKSIKLGPALIAALFGFFLASTGVAPGIRTFISQIARMINGISL
ncbi:hypothetical protein BIV57_09050 [Mangrovactinospora gilvigrisea]|uniref:DUF2304 domain-containing protein n=1 Tax=Mangrovactinospora gilvigrisea TaxID=1428644 RepID=A0A1J7BGE6_9ACTN|nr:hypothetical protein [Mangrovactinospora gilvigrisea]OIV37718.1 hypothetical protein BIV57_09050 [Mangrovactinospora gilvigrisea]